ncbi:hypothetical protein HY623_02815 [Candidatus Uhrbacteria bacterium]|nr:hypothetical protein [Candidatus Uhrbacteria bacterium]
MLEQLEIERYSWYNTRSNNAFRTVNQQETLIKKKGLLRDYMSGTSIGKDLATLLGLLYTDGCVSPKKKESWRIYFACKSKSLVDLFRSSMIGAFSLDAQRVRL